MKRQIIIGGLAIVMGTALVACNKNKKPETVEARAAYSIGYMTGKSSQAQVPKLDTESYLAGFRDAYAQKASSLTEEEMRAALTAYQQQLQKDAQVAHDKIAAEDSQKGAAFLAANAKKPGVKTTASGLQYEVITEGKGARPKATDTVKVHYEGRLIDGTVFDSSRQRNEPAVFALNQVIPGWTEGMQLMKVGSKYKFTIPSALAYGEQRMGPIPPNSVLTFEVELLDIVK